MIRYKFLYFIVLLKTVTFKRMWNALLLKVSFYISTIFKTHVIWGKPSFVSIEPTNICNLLCPECPTGNLTGTAPKGKMTIDTFARVIDEIKDTAMYINLFFQGEPFINDNAIEFIKLARKKKIAVGTSSNAHYITDKNAKDIVQSGLSKIIISMDGYNQETYELYRRNGNIEKVFKGLAALQKAKKECNSTTPIVELQCLILKHTQNNTQKIKEIGKKYSVDAVVFKTAQFYSAKNLHLVPNPENSRYTYNSETGELELNTLPKNKCWRMWSTVVFAWDGKVLPCCFDKNHTYSYGNIHENSLAEILNGKISVDFKTLVHTNRAQIDICKNCTS